MEVERSQAIALFSGLGFKAAETWTKERMMNRLLSLNSTITDQQTIGDPELDNLLDEIIGALNAGETVTLVKKLTPIDEEDVDPQEEDDEDVTGDEEDDDDADKEEQNTKTKKGKGSKVKTKKTKKTSARGKKASETKASEGKVKGKKAPAARGKKEMESKAKKGTSKGRPKKDDGGEVDQFGSKVGSPGAAINRVVLKQKSTFNAQKIAESCGMELRKVRRHLRALAKSGHLNKEKANTFEIA